MEVGYICDIRDFSGHEAAGLFVNNIEPILQDKDVKVVVETIGGLHPAYEYVRAALESGAAQSHQTKSWWPKREQS